MFQSIFGTYEFQEIEIHLLLSLLLYMYNQNFLAYNFFVCSLSECAVVDHSEQDEEMSSDSPSDVTDSDEDFTPNKTATPKQKVRHATKSQTSQNENVSIHVNKLQGIMLAIFLT